MSPLRGARGRPRFRVERVSYRVIAHATEDLEKVGEALLNTIPPHLRERVEIDAVKTRGYYGNEIVILSLTLKKKRAKEALKWVLCSLPPGDREFLISTLGMRADARSSHLHIRLDKQEAYLGRIRLSEGSDVIKIEATIVGVMNQEDMEQFLKEVIRACSQ